MCVCVSLEPQLQQLTGGYPQHSTAGGNEVRLDISAHDGIFRLKSFQSEWQSICKYRTFQSLWNQQKKGKERNNERILLIERGSFTPLVMLHLEIK